MYAKISIITLLFFVTTLSPYSPTINKDRSKREGVFAFPPIASALTPTRQTAPQSASVRPPKPQKKQAASNSSLAEASSADISSSEASKKRKPAFVDPLPPRETAGGAPSAKARRRRHSSRTRLPKITKPLKASRYEDLDANSAATIIQKNYRNYRRNKSTKDVVAMRKIAQRERKIAQKKNDRLLKQLSDVESNLVEKHALELFDHKKEILELKAKLKELATSMAPAD